MRGDPPAGERARGIAPGSTPHARGSTFIATISPYPSEVYPACAGIHLNHLFLFSFFYCLPRMRGDPPAMQSHTLQRLKSTPHARGSTFLDHSKQGKERVYPACAGIHRKICCSQFGSSCLPRMRGDPPRRFEPVPIPYESTPHARGSTL